MNRRVTVRLALAMGSGSGLASVWPGLGQSPTSPFPELPSPAD